MEAMENKIIFGDNLPVLKDLPSESVDLIYIDPPFNTGKEQSRKQIKVEKDENGDRVGFGGNRYQTEVVGERAYRDYFDDYLGFLEPRLLEAYRILKPTGSLYFHIDYREVHYCKILLDDIFGRDSFLNEIVWLMTLAAVPKPAGLPSTITFFIMSKTPGITHLIGMRWTGFPTWRRDWWGRKKPNGANSPRTPGGIRLSGLTATRRPAIRLKTCGRD